MSGKVALRTPWLEAAERDAEAFMQPAQIFDLHQIVDGLAESSDPTNDPDFDVYPSLVPSVYFMHERGQLLNPDQSVDVYFAYRPLVGSPIVIACRRANFPSPVPLAWRIQLKLRLRMLLQPVTQLAS